MKINEAFIHGWRNEDDALRGQVILETAMNAFYLGGGLRAFRDCLVGLVSSDPKARKTAWEDARDGAKETFVDFPREILAEHRGKSQREWGKLKEGLQVIGKLIRERGLK